MSQNIDKGGPFPKARSYQKAERHNIFFVRASSFFGGVQMCQNPQCRTLILTIQPVILTANSCQKDPIWTIFDSCEVSCPPRAPQFNPVGTQYVYLFVVIVDSSQGSRTADLLSLPVKTRSFSK